MMRTFIRFNLLGTLLISAAACTQPAAQVDLKGQATYGRSLINDYAANSSAVPAYNNSVSFSQAAPVTTIASTNIGVHELAPPSKNTQTAFNAPRTPEINSYQKSHPETLAPAAGNTMNLWTHRPHAIDTSDNREQSFRLQPQGKSPSSDRPVAALENIIGNDGSAKNADAVVTRKVQKTDIASSGVSGFMWPVTSKKVISQFGPKGNGKANDGINIASAEGEPVWAAADGEVVYVGNELQGYGNMVLIKHNGDKATTYAHLGRAAVDKYDRVKQGDIIGYVGTTGNVREPQLHFAIRDGKDPVDPIKYLNRKMASLQ